MADRTLLKSLAKKIPTESMLGKGVMGAGVLGATGALENMVWEAGHMASESAVGDIDFTSTNIINNLKNAAVWGGLLGAVGGFASEAIGQGVVNLSRRKPDLGLDIMDSALGVSSEAQKKYLLNPDGLINLRNEDDLALELTNRYERVAEIVRDTGQDVEELKDVLKSQKVALKSKLKGRVKVFEEAENMLDNAVKQWRKETKDIPVDRALIDEIDEDVSNLNGIISRSSQESRDILGNSDVKVLMNKKEFNEIVDKVAREVREETEGFLPETLEPVIDALAKRKDKYNKIIDEKGGYLSPVAAKGMLRSIDIDSSNFYNKSSIEFSPVKGKALKKLRFEIDQKVKGLVPEYREAMERTYSLMNLRDDVIKYYKDKDKIESTLKNLHKGIDKRYVETLENLALVSGKKAAMMDKVKALADRQLLANAKIARYRNNNDYVPVIERWNPDTGKYEKMKQATEGLTMEQKSARQIGARLFPDDMQKIKELSKDYETIKRASTKYGDVTSDEAIKYLEKKLKWVAEFDLSEKKGTLTKKTKILADAKKNITKLERFSNIDKSRQAIQTELSKADSRKVKEVFGFLSSLSRPGEIRDFVSWVEFLRLRHVFNRRFTNGSRNVNLWSGIVRGVSTLAGLAIGGVSGGLIGGAMAGNVAGIVSAGLGWTLGAYIDRYGPRVALKILQNISEIRGNLNPAKVSMAAIDASSFNSAGKQFLYTAEKGKQMMIKFNREMAAKILKATRSFTERSVRAGVILNQVFKSRESTEKDYRDLRAEVEAIEASKELYLSGIEDINDVLFPVMPNLMENLRQKNIRASDFIVSKFPKQPLSDIYDEWEPSTYELEKFKKYMDFTYKPELVLDEIEAGYISPEGVEVLSYIHPAMYRIIAETLTEELLDGENYKKLSPVKRYQLAKHFDINPMDIYRHDKTMVYQNLAAAVAGKEQAEAARGGQGMAESGQNAGQAVGNLKQTGLNSLAMDERNETRLNRVNASV